MPDTNITQDTEKTEQGMMDEIISLRQRVVELEQIELQYQLSQQALETRIVELEARLSIVQQSLDRPNEAVVQPSDRSPEKHKPLLTTTHTSHHLKHYQLLSEYSRDIVLYLNVEGQILEANQAAVKAYGYDRTELLSLTIADLRAPQTLSALSQQLQQASDLGILFETVHRRKDGTSFPVEVSAQSTVTDHETVILSVIRDITERKQAELERSQLLIHAQTARATAEVAERRARFLAEASTVLASSLNYEHTLKSVAQLAVPTLADWCVVDILKPDRSLQRLATAHVDPAKVEWAKELQQRYPTDLDAPHGVAKVLRTGRPEYYPKISDEQLVAGARDAEHLKMLREVGLKSVMIVPLVAREKIFGAISLVAAESGHSYSPDDLSLAEELARRAAIALDNARLYQEAQQAQRATQRAAERTARLQTVTAALSESLTPRQVAEVIVEQSTDALSADSALIVLLTEDGTELEIVRSIGYEPDLLESWRRFPIDAPVPLAEAVRTGEPAWSETPATRVARYPHLASVYERYDYEAWVSLPLMLQGRAVGGMLLSFKQFRELNQDDRDFMLALGRQCAQAIVRAQLYEGEQHARTAAESANRIKDEFLAVLSHELRSPLNPILGWSKLLQTRQFDSVTTARALEAIERNAKLQAQLVEDLLDVSRILQGKLRLNVSSVDLVAATEAAIETVRLSAEAKAIQIQATFDAHLGLVIGDPSRIQQVVWNLLSNAVKFTPTGGRITVTIEQVGSNAQITVTDTGQGIAPSFLPYAFDSFRQANSGTTRQFGGLGLGLAIVRHLVELHGGTVRADSPGEGLGATFTIRLPLAAHTKMEQATTPLTHQPTSLAGLRVLVVDDEADMRELLSFTLQQCGAEVILAPSAEQALTLFAESMPDVLLSDIGMPEMDGYALMRQIRAMSPEQGGQVAAIALTAYAAEVDRQQVMAAGFHKHIAKPVEPDELVRAIVAVTGFGDRG